MSEWVKFHGELTKGAKRGLPRAVRFIYMELALLARPRAGSIDLPIGMDDADGVADLLGGNQAEIKLAIRLLTSGQDPMIRFEGDAGARRLVISSWGRWNDPPGSSTARVKAMRERRRGEQSGDRVYFARRPSTGEIKIGFSDNIAERLTNISNELGERVELLGSIPGGQPLEFALHRRFAATRQRGEWFRESNDLLALIESGNSGATIQVTDHVTGHVTVTRAPGNAPRGEERREEKIRSISEPLSPPSPTETSRAPAGALGGGGLPEIFRSELAKHAETSEIAPNERHVQALAMSAFERGLRPDMVGDAVSWAAERLRIVRATAGDGCPLTDEATLLEVTKGIRGAVKKQARSAGPGGVSRVQPDAEAWANGGGYRR